MGKSKRKNKINMNFGSSQALEDQINEGRVAKNKNKKLGKIKLRSDDEDEYIDPKTTQRILKAAQKQRMDLAKEFGPTPGEATSKGLYEVKQTGRQESESESDNEPDDGKDDYNERDFFDELKMNPEDEQALRMFQNK
jgi:essential nuclear protein 1